jgi:glycerol-3-phosphate dehydrogenase (NAD+)
MGENPKTIDALSRIGDLMLTCFSLQSRNQRCGQGLIQGESISDIEKDYTVEGVPTADVAVVYADVWTGVTIDSSRVRPYSWEHRRP